MLDKAVFKSGIETLVLVFPVWKVDVTDSNTMRIWYEFFEKVSDTDFLTMIKDYCRNESSYPTIKGLFDYKPAFIPYDDLNDMKEKIRKARGE